MFLTIIYFIFILGITVFIHELGHFLFAKKFGVYVYEFSIGMGPRLFKFNRKGDETDYCIRLFPIGGYVQMAGEEVEVDEKIPVEKRLQSKKWYQRLLIMVAGVMNNFLLAIVVLFIVGLINGVTLDTRYVQNSRVEGLKDGDKIVSINGSSVNNYDKLALELAVVGDKEFTMTVKNKDVKKEVKVSPIAIGESYLIYKQDFGFKVKELKITNTSIKGITEGDTIKAINDVQVTTYYELLQELKKVSDNELVDGKKSYEFKLSLEDVEKNTKDVMITVKNNEKDKLLTYDYGFQLNGKYEHNILSSIKYAFMRFFSMIEQMIFTIFYLITGKLSIKLLSGPVGIFNVVGAASSAGFMTVLSLLALITVNVGFINLLPIPAFDGGHVLFIIIEKIKGSPVNQKVENTIHTVFLVLLMILMLFITFNDVLKLI